MDLDIWSSFDKQAQQSPVLLPEATGKAPSLQKKHRAETLPEQPKSKTGFTKGPSTGLAFQFPGWDTSFDAHHEPAASATAELLKDLEELADCEAEEAEGERAQHVEEGSNPAKADGTASGSSLHTRIEEGKARRMELLQLPEELLLRMLADLSICDIVSLGLSCRSMHAFARHDALWEKHSGSHADLSADLLVLNPLQDLRWLSGADTAGTVIVRSNRGAARQQQIQALRSKFLEVARQGLGDAVLPGRGYGLQQYLTRHLRIADRLDAKLLSLWRSHVSMRTALCDLWLDGESVEPGWLRRVILQLTRFNWSYCYEALDSSFQQVGDAIALDLQQRSMQPFELWERVLGAWHHFSDWLHRITALCDLLCQCVSAERTAEWMARGRYDTPSIMDTGRLAFRSQVLLHYGLRLKLQSALLEASISPKTAANARLLKSVKGLLLELDVPDDGTANKIYHTHSKHREVFGLEPGPMQLHLNRQLRVPALE